MSKLWRIAIPVAFFGMILGLGIFGSMYFLRAQPPNVDFTSAHPGRPVHLTLQTVGDVGPNYPNPAWVSYLVLAPNGQWVHSTQYELPAYTRINVTVYEYDTGLILRNQVWSQVTGTIGDDETVNGKTLRYVTPATLGGQAHTFTVPAMGINVPFPGVNDDAPNICEAAPCRFNSIHNIVTFSFMTGAPGQYHWQCVFPCAAAFLDGNGGPMQTLGYMDGFLKVMPSPGHPLQVGQ